MEAVDSHPEGEKRWLNFVDFMVDGAPFDLFHVLSLEADDHGAAVEETPDPL